MTGSVNPFLGRVFFFFPQKCFNLVKPRVRHGSRNGDSSAYQRVTRLGRGRARESGSAGFHATIEMNAGFCKRDCSCTRWRNSTFTMFYYYCCNVIFALKVSLIYKKTYLISDYLLTRQCKKKWLFSVNTASTPFLLFKISICNSYYS